MTRPGIEPRSLAPFANTLPTEGFFFRGLSNATEIFVEEQQRYYVTHRMGNKGVHAFPKVKVNVIAWLEFEIAYFDSFTLFWITLLFIILLVHFIFLRLFDRRLVSMLGSWKISFQRMLHTNRYIFRYRLGSVVSDTNGFINFWLRSRATRERHNS